MSVVKSVNWQQQQKKERGVKRWINRLATLEKRRSSKLFFHYIFSLFFSSINDNNQFSMCNSPRVVVFVVNFYVFFFLRCRCISDMFFLFSVDGLNSIFPHNLSHVICSADRGIIDGYLILAGIARFSLCFLLPVYLTWDLFFRHIFFSFAFNVNKCLFVEINNVNVQMCGFIFSNWLTG